MFTPDIPQGDILSANQSIQSGKSIVSAGGEFELGFFSPGTSNNRYLSIRYKKRGSGEIVWVANRERPLAEASGVLTLSREGNLNLLNGNNSIIWSSNSNSSIRNPVAQLLDTGNLVIRADNDPDLRNLLWQSFDFPDNTLLPGMKLGMNLKTGMVWSTNSWKSKDDPSPGNFSVGLDTSGYPQLFERNGKAMHFRFGSWNGIRFSGVPSLGPNTIYTYQFVFNEDEIYYTYQQADISVLTRLITEPDGQVLRYRWTNQTNKWEQAVYLQVDICGYYASCGAFSSCNINNPSRCECLNEFKPQNLKAWKSLDFSNGCIPETQLSCTDKDIFKKYTNKKFPDTRNSTYDFSMSLKDCEKMCLKNCSCTAYANTNITGKGSGCLLWFGELIDVRDQEESGQILFVRLAPSGSAASSSTTRKIALMIMLPVVIIFTVVLVCYMWYVRRYKKQNREGEMRLGEGDLPFFEFKTLANATNNFSFDCKLGEGGFGPVYKGILRDGQEIAVKRHSSDSTQGTEEFKNEVSCIAKLQHRNLVRLLGWSTKEGERMLIYEYMPNKSLDYFIFGDVEQRALLDWPKRHDIIIGIARGLLYLHQDSRLRVIHRDLKASNILLDCDMNPKISDFGMARSFGGSETEANTARVVGTFGYMSPEYALEGAFSVKSDVYSFGVLVIEMVSGKKNRFFNHPDHNLNLLGHAWTSFKEDRLSALIDGSILASKSSDQHEVFRVILIALLCVQQYPEDRPNMSSVLMMLTSKVSVPHPKQPGFFTERKLDETFSSLVKPGAEYFHGRSVTSTSSSQTVTFFAPR
ncbi:G-type lectin S-receptor-like serine/threonine-protein kinase At4g27290 isoform X2 [Apium graveolens]|uniref:G-type lectin S-receptor-like serine/threonine-protein kinase At4g27290 isoform X2 n=1 Tax=Apium graveolens TaxID=4045 RepID=UPI003D7985F1